jgi:hypothetical protein
MKTLARILLRWIINYYPKPQLEIGRGMLTEVEELHGWEALQWAFGGIQFYLKLKGANMIKNILGISSVVILAILASWLYAQHQLYLSIGVLVLGVIIAALSQPKSAFWFALIFAMMLPITHLTQAYIFSSSVIHGLQANSLPSNTYLAFVKDTEIQIKPESQWTTEISNVLTTISNDSKPQYEIAAVMEPPRLGLFDKNLVSENWDEASRMFENQPVKLALFGLPIAFLLTGLTLLLRSRFTKSPPLAM